MAGIEPSLGEGVLNFRDQIWGSSRQSAWNICFGLGYWERIRVSNYLGFHQTELTVDDGSGVTGNGGVQMFRCCDTRSTSPLTFIGSGN